MTISGCAVHEGTAVAVDCGMWHQSADFSRAKRAPVVTRQGRAECESREPCQRQSKHKELGRRCEEREE